MTTTKPQHTPAPWEITDHEDKLYIGNAQLSELAAVCGTKANAHLIAAAPELLDAACAFIETIDDLIASGYCKDDEKSLAARKAVAKAKGEA